MIPSVDTVLKLLNKLPAAMLIFLRDFGLDEAIAQVIVAVILLLIVAVAIAFGIQLTFS
jgi:high-affinity Fe2+/Pb2+ permease